MKDFSGYSLRVYCVLDNDGALALPNCSPLARTAASQISSI